MKDYKVRCVGYNANEKCFTIGKVYEVKDNTIASDNGFCYSHLHNNPNKSIIDWLKDYYKFEVV